MARTIAYISLITWACCIAARAEVSVSVRDVGGLVRLEYKCTGGELVRSFALDLAVDRGRVLAVRDYHRGETTEAAPAYGMFLTSLRDHLLVAGGPPWDWNLPDYSPLASTADFPDDTLAGVGSTGVTLEFAALWDARVSTAGPAPEGTLCTLEISEPAMVTVSANASRGGVLSATPGETVNSVFAPAWVVPVRVLDVSVVNESVTVRFSGGELETASSLDGEWAGTGDTDGDYTEVVLNGSARFYRVLWRP